jgi:hypothetical protein
MRRRDRIVYLIVVALMWAADRREHGRAEQ